jgi:hypothetical protein
MTDIIPTNMSGLDRIARVAFGIALLSLVFVGPRTDWGLLGLLPIVSGAMGFCPLYALLGIKTRQL